MKWMFYAIGALALIGAVFSSAKLISKKDKSFRKTDCIDGGVKTYDSGEGSPKSILSTEIIEFHSTFSLLTVSRIEGLDNSNYDLNAVLKDGRVTANIKWYDRNGNRNDIAFESEPEFMDRIQEIVSKYDFAQYNGYLYKISGLPHMYGASLNIRYASNESIYAHNNQSCFLPIEAIKELYSLFTDQEQYSKTI